MKNLFKNLMLVAVAAMAFTACSKENDEVNKVEKKTIFSFEATIANDDTRSGFAEKEEGATAYKSEWFGDETLKIFVTDYSSYNVETTADINAEGKFDLELTDAPENFFMTVVSPAESWASEYTATIPIEQTPLANSVDPKAHLLQAQAVPVRGGVAEISMTHLAAYGKMTVKGVDFEIDHVVIDLVGSYYGYDRELSYTIKADNVENNTFWFATEPIDVAEFTVTAFDAGGNAVAKTVDVAAAGKNLSFKYGRVGTFSVSDLKEVEEKYDSTYAYVYQSYGDTDKEIMFVAEDGRGLRIDFYDVYNDNCIVPGTYTFEGAGRMYPGWCFYYADVNGYYTSKLNDGQAVVSVEDGQYKIVFTNMADGSTVYVEQFTFKGLIDGIDFPDSRIKLAAPSNITGSADGKTITIEWNAVTGADGYRVKLYSPYDEYKEEIVTGTKYVYEAQLWSTTYSFTIMSYASNDNATYKSSEDGYVDVVTGKDPNAPFAEYIASDLYWDVSGYFVFVVDQYEIFRVKMNDADCPNHTTILEGEYTGIASSTVPAKSFSVYQKVVGGYAEGWTSTKNTSTMSVSYVDGEYVIIVNYIGAWGGSGEVGYKGVPEGWVVPGAGDSGDTPAEPTKLATPSVLGSVSGNAATVSWQEIAGAKDYTVTLNGTIVNTVEDAYIVYSDLDYSTTYSVSVVANPADVTVNSASDAGTATFTTEADPNAGDNTESFENWVFDASLNMGAKVITVTDGSHTVEFTINQVSGGTFYILDSGTLNITKVVVNDVETTDASGTVVMNASNNYHIDLNCTINGVKYTGRSNNPVV